MDAIAQPLLEVTGLHVRYGELVALRDVSLTVAEGEVVCIIGPNGAGKSTLLAAIAGGVTPDKGMIRFQGHNIVIPAGGAHRASRLVAGAGGTAHLRHADRRRKPADRRQQAR